MKPPPQATLPRPRRIQSRPGAPAAEPRLRLAAVALAALLAAGLAACGEGVTDPTGDRTPPRITLAPMTAPNDSTLAFDAAVTDNLGILAVRVRVEGDGITGVFDTTFNSPNTSLTLPYTVFVPSSVPLGTTVMVTASATDGARNISKTDTLFLATGGVQPAVALITSPHSGDSAVVGFNVGLSLSAKSPSKVRALGYQASGVLAKTDSTVFASPLKDSTATETSIDLTGASTGTLTLQPFLVDSLGRRQLGPQLLLTVVSSANANSKPTVTFGTTDRIEVSDTIHVEARDLAGIQSLGYEVGPALPNQACSAPPLAAADSFTVTGNFSSFVKTITMSLPVSSYPCKVEVRAFARNKNGVRDYARTNGTVLVDTVTVVSGLTRGLPNGGEIADALYHPPTNRIYLSNIQRNELEVFDLADSTFKTPIITGSRPWGLAAWPLNRNGAMSDTVLVANSGGTSIGYVNTRTGTEFFRYALPNILPASVTTVQSTTGSGLITQKTIYDFSDRPQYLGATCQGPAAGAAPCGDVLLVYSTTPTGGQTLPFPNQGSVRWENLSKRSSHFFFEQAAYQDQGRSDTLEVDRFAAQGVGSDSVLVPFKQVVNVTPPADTLFYSVVVTVPKLGFRDTTYVRGSGNFRRTIVGEGGPINGSRALMYDVTSGFQTTLGPYALPTPVVDNGVSRPIDVFDFGANTFAKVQGAAINFDGELAAIRGDSTYIIDRTLRLQGLLQTSGGNAGFDFHPVNAGIGPSTSPAGSRVAFSASTEPQLEVYDTWTFRRCLVIPTRDPIIGPIKSSVRAGTGDVVLVGATVRGIVVITVRASLLSTCT